MIYVALLRGINVGGNAKVEMPRLTKLFESLGLTDVTTYINSGNVIFRSSAHNDLTKKIQSAIEKEFKLTIDVTIRTAEEFHAIAKATPHNWTNDTEQKTDILFLWDEVNHKDVLKQLNIRPDIDKVKYLDGAIIWNVQRKDITRSALLKIVGTPFYKKITIRNVNTLRKLNQLIEEK